MKLAAIMSLNSAPFVGGANAAMGAIKGVISLGTGLVAPLLAGAAGFLSVAAAGKVMKDSIAGAADMEDMKNSFVTLLGSSDAAERRMRELAKFAADTPFELPGVAKASKVLESLTGGALATGKGLTMVGDMAAMAGVPFEDLSVQVGRLYAGLQNGTAVGESAMRLTELGLISAQTRQQLETLQASGAKGEAVWSVAAESFSKFSGEMERKSKGWNGMMSTFKDGIAEAMREFGAPIMDSLKPFLADGIRLTGTLAEGAKRFGGFIADGVRLFSAAWSNGSLADLIGLALRVGVSEGVNYLGGGLKMAVTLFSGNLKAIFTSLFSMEFWEGAADVVGGAFKGLGAVLMDVFSAPLNYLVAGVFWAIDKLKAATSFNYKAASYDQIYADVKKQKAFSIDAGAGDRAVAQMAEGAKKIDNTLGKGIRENAEAALKDFAPMAIFDTSALKKELSGKVSALLPAVAPQKAAESSPGDNTQAAATLPGLASVFALRQEGDRLAKIGGFVGGSSGGPAADYARRTAVATEKMTKGIDALTQTLKNSDQYGAAAAWA